MENNINNIMRCKQHQIALITGSSSGIGFETSLCLAKNGIYTYATMRNLSKSKEIFGYARKEDLPLKILRLDITDEESISESLNLNLLKIRHIKTHSILTFQPASSASIKSWMLRKY